MMKNKTPSGKEWDKVWDRGIMQRFVSFGRNIYNSFFIKELKDICGPETNLAELGCGGSSLTLQVAPEIKSVTGYDLSKSALNISANAAKKLKIKNAHFELEDCTNLRVKDNTYDVVWSQGLIEHFSDPKKIVSEHLRICKKGGTVLISVPYKYSYFYIWYLLTRPMLLRKLWPWTDQDFYTESKFDSLMDELRTKHYYEVYNMKPWIFGIIMIRVYKL